MAVFPKLPLLEPFSERTAYFSETPSLRFLLCHFRRKWHTCQKVPLSFSHVKSDKEQESNIVQHSLPALKTIADKNPSFEKIN